MAKLFIDGAPYEVATGKNLLETCLGLGMNLPYFCWHPSLGSVGACRQCAIKLFKDEKDTKGRLVMSCMEPVADAQRISIEDPEAREFRDHVIEWLMTNHPHDCAICDEGGSCHLQDMTVMTGHAYRRFEYKKRTYTNQYLGPFLNHEMNRCIQCYRCVRFYKDYAGGNDLDVFASRNRVYFGRHEDGVLENEFSGNLAEVCPTGVFTDKTLKEHYTRKWDLTMAPSVCHHCSLGCNTIAGERYGSLRMIANRYNGQVNGYFLCDRGRFGYEFVNASDRIRRVMIRGKEASRDEALSEISELIRNSKVVGIGSPRASLQSNFALKELVGKDNFYHGVTENEHDLTELALNVLKNGPARTPSLKEVEQSDAILILGEDVTNTAPMLALAVRQAMQKAATVLPQKANIPLWNDAAVREINQSASGTLFVGGLHASKLDGLASTKFYGPPDEIARLGFAVANILDKSVPAVSNLTEEQKLQAKQIAKTLSEAKRPLIITGTSLATATVIQSAANVAWALHSRNKQAGIVITQAECNSLGMAMMGGQRLDGALTAILHGYADTVIIMENDLYLHAPKSMVDEFFATAKHVIVLDHSPTSTTEKAHVIIPAGTFAESDGTLVNNEGRAQRFFQVYESTDVIQESWRWLLNIGTHAGKNRMQEWKNFESFTNAIAFEEPLLKGVDTVTPPADYRIAGQKVPREPHRYSGRTAMNANVSVSEGKPPVDTDSSLSYTMEGLRGPAPSSMIPFFWSPGWNSVQSVNKYQQEIGGSLRGGDPGVRLLEPAGKAAPYFSSVPEPFLVIENHLWVTWVHHIFGSEELSSRSPSVAQRVPTPYIMVSRKDANEWGIAEGQSLSFEIDEELYNLPIKLSDTMPPGVGGLPYGLSNMSCSDLPAWAIIKRNGQ